MPSFRYAFVSGFVSTLVLVPQVVDVADAVKANYLQAILPPPNRANWPVEARVLRTPFHDEWSTRPEALAARAAEISPQVLASVLAGDGEECISHPSCRQKPSHRTKPRGVCAPS